MLNDNYSILTEKFIRALNRFNLAVKIKREGYVTPDYDTQFAKSMAVLGEKLLQSRYELFNYVQDGVDDAISNRITPSR